MIIETEQYKQADKLAKDILTFSRNSSLVNLRLLDVAISQLKIQQVNEIDTIATMGNSFYYNVWHILKDYKLQKENTIRDYLHVIYHCLFHHPFINEASPSRLLGSGMRHRHRKCHK